MTDLDKKLDSWKKNLLDLSKRNPLIHYRDTKRSSLRIIQPNIDQLWEDFVVDEQPLVFPYIDVSTEDDDQHVDEESIVTNQPPKDREKTLRNIRNRARSVMEEQGVNVLFLAFGFLQWTEAPHSNEVINSPLILVPVKISWESITSPFRLLRHEDDIQFNATLSHKLNEYGYDIEKFEDENGSGDLEAYFKRLENQFTHTSWRVHRSVGLGLFSFLKMNMYNDLKQNRDAILSHPIIRSLCGDSSAVDTSSFQDLLGFDHDTNISPDKTFQILDADSSQQDAILLAKRGASFVLQGPPGTGKSQTIANIIAELLANNKKVLFVSEKMAALEVVYRRLANADLGVFCLSLHSHKANKMEVLEQLRESIELAEKRLEPMYDTMAQLDLLTVYRNELNEYVKTIHNPIPPLNRSIFEVYGELAKLDSYPNITCSIPDVEKLPTQNLNRKISRLTRLTETIENLKGDLYKNPWYGSTITSTPLALQSSIRTRLNSFLKWGNAIVGLFSEMETIIDFDFSSSYLDLKTAISILKTATSSPIVPELWLQPDQTNILKTNIQENEELFNRARQSLAQYRQALRNIQSTGVTPSVGLDEIETLSDAENQSARLKQIIEKDRHYKHWSTLNSQDAIQQFFDEAAHYAQEYNSSRQALLSQFDLQFLEIDPRFLLARFKIEYKPLIKFFKSQYKQDKMLIQSHLKEPVKLNDKQLLEALTYLTTYRASAEWFEANAEKLKLYFYDDYTTPSADYNTIKTKLHLYDGIDKTMHLLDECLYYLTKIESNENRLRESYGHLYTGISTDWLLISENLRWVENFRQLVSNNHLSTKFFEGVCCSELYVDHCANYCNKLEKFIQELAPEYEWFIDKFDEITANYISEMMMPALVDRASDCLDGQFYLQEWIEYQNIRRDCITEGLGDFIQKFEEQKLDTRMMIGVFLKRFYVLWLDIVMARFDNINGFRRQSHENNIENFRQLDSDQLEIAKLRLIKQLIEQLPNTQRVTTGRDDELGILKNELGKRRRIMPLRKLFTAIPNLLLELKPCLMMSPLTVSLFLESESYVFDTVIFDEASQVTTENAVGAIYRGKQAIIVGDSKQLPPTDFFSVSTSSDDFDTDDEDDDDYDIDAFESVLDEANSLPTQELRWHYRSKHEHLIAFSNSKYYRNRLTTFPSSVEKLEGFGVEYIYVPNGVYNNGNAEEAKRVAELVFEHFNKYPSRSLGVVAFGTRQQDEIDVAIRKKRLENQEFENFFSENGLEPFFIKNLETVQGDERDTIIFSIGYAKTPSGQMHMRFGPLGKQGGERRLNVAITRAKLNVKLVGSIMPTDIAVERIKRDGPKHLRSYIEFAMRGSEALMREPTASDDAYPESPFEESVYQFLEDKGYSLKAQVGCSGYRIDMAVKHPTLSGRYVLGIECDGASYHSTRTARERDRLRQTVLEDMGWKIYRIWSTDWIKNSAHERNRLLEAVANAIDEYREDYLPVASKASEAKNTSTEDTNSNNYQLVKKDINLENPYGFQEYTPVTREMLDWTYSYMAPAEKMHLVINSEFPVHFEYFCQLFASDYGAERATSNIKQQIRCDLSRMNGVKIYGDFIWPDPLRKITVKIPNQRDIKYISKEELAEAMWIVVNSCPGWTKVSLIREITRIYGYNRMGNRIESAMNLAYQSLLATGKIKEIEGTIVL